MGSKKITVERSIALDDSCQFKLYARGHHTDDEFETACLQYMAENRREHRVRRDDIRRTHWRTVRAESDNIVSDWEFIESKAGRGAYAVTILDCWYPIHEPKQVEPNA